MEVYKNRDGMKEKKRLSGKKKKKEWGEAVWTREWHLGCVESLCRYHTRELCMQYCTAEITRICLWKYTDVYGK